MFRCSSPVRAGRAGIAALLLLAAVASSAREYPEFEGEALALGREVWLANCETCHAYGVAGAPLANDTAQWQARRQQGLSTLYQHAIEGFFGPRGTMMPPRGANDALTDEEVRAAVDYMLRLAAQGSTN